jgi:hypothetical protein
MEKRISLRKFAENFGMHALFRVILYIRGKLISHQA